MNLALNFGLQNVRLQTVHLLKVVRQFLVSGVDPLLGQARLVNQEDWRGQPPLEDALVAAEYLRFLVHGYDVFPFVLRANF